MTSDTEIAVCGFKLEVKAKRRFDAAMRAEGTTMSKVIREAVLRYLSDVERGVEHPQFQLETQVSSRNER